MTFRRIFNISWLFLIILPSLVSAESRVLISGLSVRFDYDNQRYKTVGTDSDSFEGSASENKKKDTESNAALGIRPLLQFLSESRQGALELRSASGIKHDFIDSEFDWEVDIYLSAAQTLSRNWKLKMSDTLLRLDEHDPLTSATDDQGAGQVEGESSTSELAADRGRSRYWLNTLDVLSEHPYGEDSQFGLGFNYRILRNDETAVRGYEDYDRSEISLRQRHRFDSAWKAGADFSVIRGDFDPIDAETAEEDDTSAPQSMPADEELSDDLKEYRLKALMGNNSFRRHDLSLEYFFIGARYDDTAQNDGDIHEGRLVWQHEYSRHISTKLGAGPSYEKAEGQDANWGGNGIAELKYLFRPGSLSFTVEKGYDVDNFSGSGERGVVDFWNFKSAMDYRVLKNLLFDGHLTYRHEDRRHRSAADESEAEGEEENVEQNSYSKNRYSTGVGLRYVFLQDYSTSFNYTFVKQDSEKISDDYDDHRLVLIVSWQKQWLRW